MFEYGVPSIAVPLQALVPAIAAESLAVAWLLEQKASKAFVAGTKAGIYSVLIVVTLIVLFEFFTPERFNDKGQLSLVRPLSGWALDVSLLALVPGFVIAWWIKHLTIRQVAQAPAGAKTRWATLQTHLIATATMVVAGAASLYLWPVHGNYNVREKFAEVLGKAREAQDQVGDFWLAHGRFPASSSELPQANYSTAIAEVTVQPGGRVIVRALTPRFPWLDGKRTVLAPRLSEDGARIEGWLCGTSEIDWTHVPSECRNGPPGGIANAAGQAVSKR